MVEDVIGIGRVLGLKYKGDVMNKFNMLSKEGRSQMRAVVGRGVSDVEVGDRGWWWWLLGVDGCE